MYNIYCVKSAPLQIKQNQSQLSGVVAEFVTKHSMYVFVFCAMLDVIVIFFSFTVSVSCTRSTYYS